MTAAASIRSTWAGLPPPKPTIGSVLDVASAADALCSELRAQADRYDETAKAARNAAAAYEQAAQVAATSAARVRSHLAELAAGLDQLAAAAMAKKAQRLAEQAKPA